MTEVQKFLTGGDRTKPDFLYRNKIHIKKGRPRKAYSYALFNKCMPTSSARRHPALVCICKSKDYF